MKLLAFLLLAGAMARAQAPLPNAHAHNDYLHKRPLVDALEHGFCSVEADIHLVNGQLLVAHDPEQVHAERTLEKLYLAPLKERVGKNGGQVHAAPSDFFLLVDLKTAAEPTYAALSKQLKAYESILTEFRKHRVQKKAVTVIISGNRPIGVMSNETLRLAALDGRLSDVSANPSRRLFPWVSDNWTRHFQWRGEGPLSIEEREKLREIVRQVHEQGRKLRFWATPDTPTAWRELRAARVDFINTDDLEGLSRFLAGSSRE